MNAWELMRQVKAALEPNLERLPLPVRGRDANDEAVQTATDEETLRPAKVYLGSMPPTSNEAFSAAPFIVIQPLNGFDDEQGCYNVRLALRLCIVSDDLEGAENDMQNLISTVRMALLSLPGNVLGDGQYRITEEAGNGGKAPWERPDDQVYPFIQAHIFTTWQTQGVANEPV